MLLSGHKTGTGKTKGLQCNIFPHKDRINELRKQEQVDAESFLREFSHVSAIWRIMLLHIVSPNEYPIFDVHVWRAYNYLNKGERKELPSNNLTKIELYKKEYLPFFNELSPKTKEPNRKSVDEALWAFGKFLKPYFATESNPPITNDIEPLPV